MKWKFSFRQIWMFSLMFIVLLFTLGSLYMNSHFLMKELEDDISESGKIEAIHTIGVFDAYLDNINSIYANILLDTQLLDFSEDIQNNSLDYLDQLSYKIIGGNSIVHSIYLVDLDSGICYGSVDGIIPNSCVPWLEQAMEMNSGGLIRDYEQLSYIGRIGVIGTSGMIIGINVNTFNLEDKVIPMKAEDEVIHYIADSEGNVLLGDYQEGSIIDVANLEGSVGENKLKIDDIDYRLFYAKSDNSHCYYINCIPEEVLFEPVINSRNRILLLIFVLMLIVILISVLMSSYLSKPIYILIDMMQSYKQKDGNKGGEDKLFLPKENTHTNREYNALYANFNEMTTRIDLLIEDIKVTEHLKANEQVKNIQGAVRPHFTYNLLNSIVWLIYDGKNDDAADVLIRTANFLRNSLKTQRNYVTIKEEVDTLNNYFELLNFTMQDELKWSFYCSEVLYACKIISLGIQPLVENCIKHGFKERAGVKQIDIFVTREDSDVLIRVKDNGIGIQGDRLRELNEMLSKDLDLSDSFGLWNIQKRCHLLYGNGYGISIQSEYKEGTTITLRIPWEEDEYA